MYKWCLTACRLQVGMLQSGESPTSVFVLKIQSPSPVWRQHKIPKFNLDKGGMTKTYIAYCRWRLDFCYFDIAIDINNENENEAHWMATFWFWFWKSRSRVAVVALFVFCFFVLFFLFYSHSHTANLRFQKKQMELAACWHGKSRFLIRIT
jgi:hypothetical protein